MANVSHTRGRGGEEEMQYTNTHCSNAINIYEVIIGWVGEK